MSALQLAVAFVVGVLGVARAVRLITSDAYPPMEALRVRWQVAQGNRDNSPHMPGTLRSIRYGWGPLLTCPFCCAPYVTAAALAAAIWANVWTPDLHTLAGWWWVLAIWAAGSYAAAMVVVRDEPPPVEG